MPSNQIHEGYHYIIPAKLVEISPNAYIPLLYGLISSLCNKEGYCWANNDFLAKTLGKSIQYIKKNLNWLVKKSFLISEINQKEGNTRRIYLNNIPIMQIIKKHVKYEGLKITTLEGKTNYKRGGGSATPVAEVGYSSSRGSATPVATYIYKDNNKDIRPPNSDTPIIPQTNKESPPPANALVDFFLFRLNSKRKDLELHEIKAPKSWIEEAKRLLKRYSIDKIKELIDFSYKSDYWKDKIASVTTLRKVIHMLEEQEAQYSRTAMVKVPRDSRFKGVREEKQPVNVTMLRLEAERSEKARLKKNSKRE